jgi:hypothetical protein
VLLAPSALLLTSESVTELEDIDGPAHFDALDSPDEEEAEEEDFPPPPPSPGYSAWLWVGGGRAGLASP